LPDSAFRLTPFLVMSSILRMAFSPPSPPAFSALPPPMTFLFFHSAPRPLPFPFDLHAQKWRRFRLSSFVSLYSRSRSLCRFVLPPPEWFRTTRLSPVSPSPCRCGVSSSCFLDLFISPTNPAFFTRSHEFSFFRDLWNDTKFTCRSRRFLKPTPFPFYFGYYSSISFFLSGRPPLGFQMVPHGKKLSQPFLFFLRTSSSFRLPCPLEDFLFRIPSWWDTGRFLPITHEICANHSLLSPEINGVRGLSTIPHHRTRLSFVPLFVSPSLHPSSTAPRSSSCLTRGVDSAPFFPVSTPGSLLAPLSLVVQLLCISNFSKKGSQVPLPCLPSVFFPLKEQSLLNGRFVTWAIPRTTTPRRPSSFGAGGIITARSFCTFR